MSKYNEVMENIKVTDEMRQRILQNIEKEVGGADKYTKEKKSAGAVVIRFITQYGAKVAVFALVILGAYGVVRTVGLNSSHNDSATSMYEAESAMAPEDFAGYETAEATEEPGFSYDAEEATEAAGVAEEAEATEEAVMEAAEATEDSSSDRNLSEGRDFVRYATAGELSEAVGFVVSDIDSLVADATEVWYLAYDDGAEIRYALEDDTIRYLASDKGLLPVDVGIDADEDLEDMSVSTMETGTDDTTANVTLYKNSDSMIRMATWEDNGILRAVLSDEGMTEDKVAALVKQAE